MVRQPGHGKAAGCQAEEATFIPTELQEEAVPWYHFCLWDSGEPRDIDAAGFALLVSPPC